MTNPQLNQKLEFAIKFLVKAFNELGNNPKPVILHSIEVAIYLKNLDYNEKIITGALLHDILEDTSISKKEIKESFGLDIFNLIASLTFDSNISNRVERAKHEIDQCLKAGKDSMIIKAADLLQNADYIQFAKDLETKNYIFQKIKYFLDRSSPLIGTEKPWIDLKAKYQQILDKPE